MRRIFFAVFLLILLNLVLAACGESPQIARLVPEIAPRLNYLAPDFQLTDYNGNHLKLSDFRGKPVLINFWATWCPPCRAEMPEIEAVYQKYHKKYGFEVLGVDAREEIPTVKKYVEDGNYSWKMLMDFAGNTIATYGVVAFPSSFFIDPQGYIRATQVGGMDKKGLQDRLGKIIQN